MICSIPSTGLENTGRSPAGMSKPSLPPNLKTGSFEELRVGSPKIGGLGGIRSHAGGIGAVRTDANQPVLINQI